MNAARRPAPGKTPSAGRTKLARIRSRQARRRALRTAGLAAFAAAFALGLGVVQFDLPL